MAFDWTSLIGGSVTDGVAKIISLFKVDPNLALAHQADLEKIQADMQNKLVDAVQAMSAAQNAVNAAEAASPKLFIAGWRPFIGWVCGAGLSFQFIVGPLVTWIAALAKHAVAFPQLDMGTLLTLLLGMLGLGGMRTFEKVSGVNDVGKG